VKLSVSDTAMKYSIWESCIRNSIANDDGYQL